MSDDSEHNPNNWIIHQYGDNEHPQIEERYIVMPREVSVGIATRMCEHGVENLVVVTFDDLAFALVDDFAITFAESIIANHKHINGG